MAPKHFYCVPQGGYDCQVGITPRISRYVHLTVVGKAARQLLGRVPFV